MMLGGYNVFGIGAYAEKTFTALPPHTGIRIRFTFTRIDAWSDGDGLLLVDSVEAWRKSFHWTDTFGSVAACGAGGHAVNNEIPAHVDVTVDHYAEDMTIRVTSSTTGSNSFWGMNDMIISLVIPHPSPPAPPATPGVWMAPVNEDRWPGATGWTGTSLKMTACAQFGTMLGGYQVLDASAYVEKTFTNLPSHQTLRLRLTFTRVDNLDTGLIHVDGAETWRRTFGIYSVVGSEPMCGAANRHSFYYEIQEKVDLMVTHSAESVTIRVGAAGTTGWWGIQRVRIETAASLPSR